MTAVAGAEPAHAEDDHAEVGVGPFTHLLRSEWTKLRSVRSTFWTLLVTAVLVVGLAVLLAALVDAHWDSMPADERTGFDPTRDCLVGVVLAQLAVTVLGVLVASGEYRSGLIRTSLAAVPHRWRLLLAKATVLAAVTVAVGLVSCLGAFTAGQVALADRTGGASLRDPQVARVVVGAALLLGVCGLFGLAMGVLLRHAAGAVTAAVAVLHAVPVVVAMLPGVWGDRLGRYYPSNAGQQIWAAEPAQTPGPWAGFAIFCLFVAALLVAGGVLLNRRDA